MTDNRFKLLCLLVMLILSSLTACEDGECETGARKCDGHTFYSCYNFKWRSIECKDAAPVCNAQKGCQKSDEHVGPTDSPPVSEDCAQTDNMCVGSNFYTCPNGKWVIVDCTQTSKPYCDGTRGCLSEPPDSTTCASGTHYCEENTFYNCVNAKLLKTECIDATPLCDASFGCVTQNEEP